MDDVSVRLVEQPRPLENYVAGFGAVVEVHEGQRSRRVRLLASATDFSHLGAGRRPTDQRLWNEIAERTGNYLVDEYSSLDTVPREVRVAAVLGI